MKEDGRSTHLPAGPFLDDQHPSIQSSPLLGLRAPPTALASSAASDNEGLGILFLSHLLAIADSLE